MGCDICSAPGCGAFMKDDSLPCPECQGRGYANPFGGKEPWTNSRWADERAAEVVRNKGKS